MSHETLTINIRLLDDFFDYLSIAFLIKPASIIYGWQHFGEGCFPRDPQFCRASMAEQLKEPERCLAVPRAISNNNNNEVHLAAGGPQDAPTF